MHSATAHFSASTNYACIKASVVAVFVAIALIGVARSAQSQTGRQGQVLFAAITQQYPQVQLTAYSWATEDPDAALVIPVSKGKALSKDKRASLALYVQSMIPALRTAPEQYLYTDPYAYSFQHQRLPDIIRTRFTKLCAQCWVIGVGSTTTDKKGVVFEKIMMQGRRQVSGNGSFASSAPPPAVAQSEMEELSTSASATKAGEFDVAKRNRSAVRRDTIGYPTVTVTAETAYLFDRPRLSAIVGSARRGDSFTTRSFTDGWYKIDYQGQVAWVHKSVAREDVGSLRAQLTAPQHKSAE